jgi:hypothetical protein
MEIHFVKWSSAAVTRKGLLPRRFELRARITGGEASQEWREAFEAIARRRAEETNYALWISADLNFEADTIVIEIPEEGHEDAILEAFDEIVVAANTATEEALALAVKRDQAELDESEPRNVAARKVQQRFRSRSAD